MARSDTAVRPSEAASPERRVARGYYPELFLVSFAGLLLEIGYTRVISFKLFYYWGWAVNGFASVVGATLTTVLSMTFGFNVVLALALASYVLALAALYRLAVPPRAVLT